MDLGMFCLSMLPAGALCILFVIGDKLIDFFDK